MVIPRFSPEPRKDRPAVNDKGPLFALAAIVAVAVVALVADHREPRRFQPEPPPYSRQCCNPERCARCTYCSQSCPRRDTGSTGDAVK